MSSADRWREDLRGWAIPEPILESAPESPYGFPVECFQHRAQDAANRDLSPTLRVAAEALPEGGSVLDVGAGGGASSLPLSGRASQITAVDQSAGMLDSFLQAADAMGVGARAVMGSWPDVAGQVDLADVVVCANVLYNVWELEPFARALDDNAGVRVVIEISDRHPLQWMNDLWLHFHDAVRPTGPTADDAVVTLREMGLQVQRQNRLADEGHGYFVRRVDAIALVRRRLCLPSDADEQIADALGERLMERDGAWSVGPAKMEIVTLWWDKDEPADLKVMGP